MILANTLATGRAKGTAIKVVCILVMLVVRALVKSHARVRVKAVARRDVRMVVKRHARMVAKGVVRVVALLAVQVGAKDLVPQPAQVLARGGVQDVQALVLVHAQALVLDVLEPAKGLAPVHAVGDVAAVMELA